ncbi:uncharacterized protein LOC126887803 [Diabrotica virgifera virgifera]|uniref:Uncharacterized protein n=1 Tax=Diabrotica virgifera virgifera TaxID=50390 RepID=A0ABM5KN15_DIAVI|nr:uncharacterized protein LOC126887803 [Diabrotica virgifera virgifera]
MLRIPWTAHRTNVSILNQLKIKKRLSTICLQRILQFFGHVVRRGDDSLERLIVSGNVPGRRSRGRSLTRWSEQIKHSAGNSFCEALRAAEDRDQWRNIVRNIGRNHDPQ